MDYERYTKGLYIIGKLTEFNDGETVAEFLLPEGQALVRETFIEHAKRASDADQGDDEVTTTYDGEEAFNRLNDLVKYRLQQEVDALAEQVEEAHVADQKTATDLRNQPHASGTTAELATKLGVSKSEVRRMKRDGTLDAALANAN